MGSGGSKGASSPPADCPAAAAVNAEQQGSPSPDAAAGACPVLAPPGINPANLMPLEPRQQPAPGQRHPLAVERLVSTIPKANSATPWVYPSPQMFYNALRRKGKDDGVTEADMPAVVAAHNSMNEATWQRVLMWEALHDCPDVRLRRFCGRPDALSPLARLRSWAGGPLPFDRHDWVVERCGREVRYVIDFYFDEARAGTPHAFEVVARPALDSPGAALDRLKMGIYTAFARWGLPCPVTGSAAAVGRRMADAQATAALAGPAPVPAPAPAPASAAQPAPAR